MDTSSISNLAVVVSESVFLSSTETPSSEDDDAVGLEETFEQERNYLRERLQRELGREPTEQELDEWLQRHTEGY